MLALSQEMLEAHGFEQFPDIDFIGEEFDATARQAVCPDLPIEAEFTPGP